ncbi:PEP-CTERM sorting domain-containing protein [Nitrogeniibacter aestuarii]|uniref:PEP-CTERM sorting domain-containing protein n=1 Tax=Nitrogeniibacter aestuarii TaxID=2815343 RepID=UPI001E5807E7|nr:PEP-CTERM sorting domain-containing protein [Nitrogeniibacter aestuarii]
MRLALLAATSLFSLSAHAVVVTNVIFDPWPITEDIVTFESVTAPSSVNGLDAITDGVKPDPGSSWQSQTWWTDSSAEIHFTLPGLYQLGNIGLFHDSNDDYALYASADGQAWDLLASFPASNAANDGMVSGYTFPLFNAPAYRELRLTASGGDGQYGIGEIAVTGVSAVPEASSVAMMLTGLGLLGAVARKKQYPKQ